MNNSELVTIRQAEILNMLGFNGPTMRHAYRFSKDAKFILQKSEVVVRTERKHDSNLLILVPTVDQAIEWMRKKFHVIVYNSADPFVDPIKKCIIYCYAVKFCNVKNGWNWREVLGNSGWSNNSNAMKRKAIDIALKYIKQKNYDVKKVQNRGNRTKKAARR